MTGKKRKIKRKKLGSYPYHTVVFSITMALAVSGLFSLLLLHANRLSEIIKDKFEVHVYLKKDLSENQIDSLKTKFAKLPFLLKKEGIPQLSYISRDQAAETFKKETGEDFYKVLGDNPLRASFILKIPHSYADSTRMEEIKASISEVKGVYEVDYKQNLITQINNNIKTISFVLIVFALLLLTISVLLINNTLRLALFSQRFLIRSMQLVGATKGFIQRPFLFRAALQGLFSGIIASALLFLLLNYLYSSFPELRILKNYNFVFFVFAGLTGAGVIIGLYSSYRAVKKYLKMSLDELY